MMNENVVKPNTDNTLINTVKEYIGVFVGAVILAILISLVVKPGVVIGSSMEPTMSEGDYVLINKIAYKTSEPEYGDIIIADTNVEGGKILIKRVIGLPGDTVEVIDNEVYLNGILLDESYINEPMVNNENIKVTVPENEVFVMGDNRNHSLDSRSLVVGTINYKEDIIGKVVFGLFPFKSIK